MKLIRLPLSVFEDLYGSEALVYTYASRDDELNTSTEASLSSEQLRSALCSKLLTAKGTYTRQGGSIKRRQLSTSTTGQLLQMTPYALLRAVDPLLTFVECQELIQRISCHCSAKSQSVLSIISQPKSQLDNNDDTDTHQFDDQAQFYGPLDLSLTDRHISSGMESLDNCLRGGVRVGSITEIVGLAGVGKTQLAMQLCIMTARLEQGSIFIDTERKFCMPRFEQLCRERLTENHSNYENVLANISLHSPTTINELETLIQALEEDIALSIDLNSSESVNYRYPIRLIILDSIAALALREYSTDDAPRRTATLFRIVQTLKRMAIQLQLAVVVINQGTGSSSSMDVRMNEHPTQLDDHTSAALGSSWHHCVTTRILLEYDRNIYTGTKHKDGQDRMISNIQVGCIRKATVVKSNIAPCSSVRFEIRSSGLHPINYLK